MTINQVIVITSVISVGFFTILFIVIIEKIGFHFWWRRMKRFIDRQYEEAAKKPREEG